MLEIQGAGEERGKAASVGINLVRDECCISHRVRLFMFELLQFRDCNRNRPNRTGSGKIRKDRRSKRRTLSACQVSVRVPKLSSERYSGRKVVLCRTLTARVPIRHAVAYTFCDIEMRYGSA